MTDEDIEAGIAAIGLSIKEVGVTAREMFVVLMELKKPMDAEKEEGEERL